MGVEENKQLALSWFQALVEGDAERAQTLLHPSFRYFLPGTLPASGWWDAEGFLASAHMFAGILSGPLTMRVGDVTAEQDRVWIEAESDAPLAVGGRYNNTYVMAIRVRDGKVVELKEFSDTLHVFEAIDAPEVRGPRKPRQSPIGRVSRTIAGASIGAAGRADA